MAKILREKAIKLLNTEVLTTFDKYEDDYKIDGVLVITKGSVKPIQKVIQTSDYAKTKGVNNGDLVKIDLNRYIKVVPLHNYDSAQERTLAPDGKKTEAILIPPEIELGGTSYLLLDYSDIKYCVTETEEITVETPRIIVPKH